MRLVRAQHHSLSTLKREDVSFVGVNMDRLDTSRTSGQIKKDHSLFVVMVSQRGSCIHTPRDERFPLTVVQDLLEQAALVRALEAGGNDFVAISLSSAAAP